MRLTAGAEAAPDALQDMRACPCRLCRRLQIRLHADCALHQLPEEINPPSEWCSGNTVAISGHYRNTG